MIGAPASTSAFTIDWFHATVPRTEANCSLVHFWNRKSCLGSQLAIDAFETYASSGRVVSGASRWPMLFITTKVGHVQPPDATTRAIASSILAASAYWYEVMRVAKSVAVLIGESSRSVN